MGTERECKLVRTMAMSMALRRLGAMRTPVQMGALRAMDVCAGVSQPRERVQSQPMAMPFAARYANVPENWGQPQTGGTTFLGTPKNYLELNKKRPLSPDLFGVNGGTHYDFPIAALSSITTRITGVVLSGAIAAGGLISLGSDPALAIDSFKQSFPMLVPPLKFALSFPFVFHTLSGFRHLYWDFTCKGISNPGAAASSKFLFGAAVAGSLVMTVI